MTTQRKVYRSRISILLLIIISFITIPVSISLFQDGSLLDKIIYSSIILIFTLLITGIRYVISGNILFIRIWFIPFGKVDINEISSIKRSYNPLSSPAASLKRLAIYRYSKPNVVHALISPNREKEFIEQLTQINPNIWVDMPQREEKGGVCDWDI